MKKTLETVGYRLRNAFGRVIALIDNTQEVERRTLRKKAAIAGLSVTILPALQDSLSLCMSTASLDK